MITKAFYRRKNVNLIALLFILLGLFLTLYLVLQVQEIRKRALETGTLQFVDASSNPLVGNPPQTSSGNVKVKISFDASAMPANTPTPTTGGGGAIWRPPPNTSWQIQYNDIDIAQDLNLNVDVYFIDMFRNDASTVSLIHSKGKKAICYIDYGSWEADRPDAADYPQAILGNEYPGYPDERWVDIRSDLLKPILQRRMDLCKQKGFDGIVPDNLIGYLPEFDTGFNLTADDQLIFDRWVFDQAHARNLSIGLLNDEDHVVDLLPYIDWAMIEDCYPYTNCQKYTPVIQAGKAVFDIEYPENSNPPLTLAQFCPTTQALQISALLKHLFIDAYREACS